MIVKAGNIQRDFQGAEEWFHRHYFENAAVYNDKNFVGNFLMPRTIFVQQQNDLGKGRVFQLNRNALNKSIILPFVRIIVALRILAYEKSYVRVDEIFGMLLLSARVLSWFFDGSHYLL